MNDKNSTPPFPVTKTSTILYRTNLENIISVAKLLLKLENKLPPMIYTGYNSLFVPFKYSSPD